MSQKNVKELRRQLRNVVQELLPTLLKEELTAAAVQESEKRLRDVFGARLEAINNSIMAQLGGIDQRSKDVSAYLMNQAAIEAARNAPPTSVDQTLPDSANLEVPVAE